jgi:hypothetical protein
MNKQQFNNYVELLNSLTIENVDLQYFASSDHTSAQDLYDSIEEGDGFNVEIIYYYNAIEYLKDNDNSLRESLEIAQEFGYEAKDINSELLASLLASQYAREEFENSVRSKVQDFFDSLEEEEEETTND